MINLNRLDFISMEIQSWSNNNPATIAGLFLKATEDLEVFPRCVRTDCGTENGLLAAAQCYFNRDHDHKSHLYGSSNHNQRIESWWSQFRKLKSNFIIDLFKDMISQGIYNTGNIFINVVLFIVLLL